jgi:hypothetical protein
MLIYGGQTVATTIGATSGRFIIDNSVGKRNQVLI